MLEKSSQIDLVVVLNNFKGSKEVSCSSGHKELTGSIFVSLMEVSKYSKIFEIALKVLYPEFVKENFDSVESIL